MPDRSKGVGKGVTAQFSATKKGCPEGQPFEYSWLTVCYHSMNSPMPRNVPEILWPSSSTQSITKV